MARCVKNPRLITCLPCCFYRFPQMRLSLFRAHMMQDESNHLFSISPNQNAFRSNAKETRTNQNLTLLPLVRYSTAQS
jgi:hypothetical protein